MKSHTSEFKEEIKTLGKQQSVRITYKENNVTKTLTDEDINSATPNYEASLLKSVMKVLELDSNISIPKDTEIKFEYGLLVNGAYEYLDYGNYIVAKEPEKQEDTLSYKITCYDKMLYSMKDYEHIDIPYPCTIKQYLVALCNKIGLQFKDSDFANASRQITNELFMTINEDGTYSSMGYTYRDVLDQIAETTGGCICITLDDKVEVRYINKTINYETSKKSTNIEFESSVKEIVKIKELDGKSTQDGTPTPSNPVEIKSIGESWNIFNKDALAKTSGASKTILDTGVRVTQTSAGYYRYIGIELGKSELLGKTYTISAAISKNANNLPKITMYYGNDSNMTIQSISFNLTTTGKKIFTFPNTFPANCDRVFLLMYSNVNGTGNVGDYADYTNLQVYEGTEEKPYRSYGNNIFIEQKGKNKLINSSFRENWTGWWTSNNGTIPIEITEKLGQKCLHITGELQKAKTVAQHIQERVEKGKTYTLSCMAYLKDYVSGTINPYISFYTDGKTTNGSWTSGIQTLKGYLDFNNSNYDYSKGFVKITSTFKIKEDTDLTKALGLYVYARDCTGDLYVYDIQLEEGTEATDYEEYFNNTYTLPLSEPLRSLPNGTKDTIEEDGIHRRVRHLSLAVSDMNGSENYPGWNNLSQLKEDLGSNYNTPVFPVSLRCNILKDNTYLGLNTKVSGSLFLNKSAFNLTQTEWKEQYPNLVVEINYELSEEVVEPFTDEQKEIISSMVTEKGTNIFELESNAILNYPVNYDTINEEYINDTNVNFGEKYRTY